MVVVIVDCLLFRSKLWSFPFWLVYFCPRWSGNVFIRILAIPDAIVIENDIKKSTLPVIDLPAPTAPPVAPTTRAPPISSTTSRNPLLASVKLPCSCKGRECGCCTGLVLERFRQKACFNTTYDPDEFQVNAAITLNNRVLYKNSISGFKVLFLPMTSFSQVCCRQKSATDVRELAPN